MNWSLRLLRAATVSALTLSAIAFPADAQRDTWALTNVRIVPVSGPAIARGTVVIRDGLIIAAAADATIPPDARVLDLSGKTLYPGLIDAASTAGLAIAATGGGRAGGPGGFGGGGQGADTAARRGLDPDRIIMDELRPGDAAVGQWRDVGVTSALVSPNTGAWRGQSALVNLRGDEAGAMVVRSPVAQHMGYEGQRGQYPATLMGVMAYERQSLLDAQYYTATLSRYDANPRGMKRPESDPHTVALVPFVTGKGRVIIDAGSERSIRRSVKLANEFKLDYVLSGVSEGWQALDVLVAEKRPVLVSLAFAAPDSMTGRAFLHTRPEAPPPDSTLQWLIYRNAAVLDSAGIKFALTSGGGRVRAADFRTELRKAVTAGLKADAALRALTMTPAEILGVADRLGSIEPGKIANLIVTNGELLDDSTRIEAVFVDGQRFLVEPLAAAAAAGRGGNRRDRVATAPASLPSLPVAPSAVPRGRLVAITNATILTASHGTIQRGTIVVRDGKIIAVGADVRPPAGAEIIDASGKYVIPGIIDSHSHMALEGGINEGTDNLTPQVRVADEIAHDDMSIWNALAGGVTTAHLLHGSANSIGGQDAVIKMRWGLKPDQLLVESAQPGIKFALGENPKGSNRTVQPGRPQRFPNTRMGVEYSIAEAFQRAREYQHEWSQYDSARVRVRRGQEGPVAPRRDLFLEELSGILSGKVRVHSHSYRADEILMLIQLADSLGFKIATFQHVLEGYKVADEIARHGAGGSTFADMWAYKLEAWDAIPYNAALMAERGVRVSINSDSDERVRRMFQEAAKMMKYGAASEEAALRTITLNPAHDVGLGDRVGSIDVGKEADLVIMTRHPFDPATRVEKTLIDGVVYFDYDKAPKLQDRLKKPGGPVTSEEGR